MVESRLSDMRVYLEKRRAGLACNIAGKDRLSIF